MTRITNYIPSTRTALNCGASAVQLTAAYHVGRSALVDVKAHLAYHQYKTMSQGLAGQMVILETTQAALKDENGFVPTAQIEQSQALGNEIANLKEKIEDF